MIHLAHNSEHGNPWLKDLAWFQGRGAYVTRIALICILTLLVTQIYRTPEAALATYIVFFLKQPDRTTSVIQSLAMLLLVTVLIAFIFIVARIVINDPLWRVFSIAGLSFGLLFATSASKLKPVGAIIALVVGYALDLLGSAPFGEAATRALLYGWLIAAIPISVSIVYNLALAPAPRRLAEKELSMRLRLAVHTLECPGCHRREVADVLGEGDDKIVKWLKMASLEKTSPGADIAALRQATRSTNAILQLLAVSSEEKEISLPAEVAFPITQTLMEIATVLDTGKYPLDISLDIPEQNLSSVSTAFTRALCQHIVNFAEPVQHDSADVHKEEDANGFWQADAFTNPEHWRYALKTTIAAIVCYVIYKLLVWPGIHTCFITCYIVSLETAAETIHKLILRIVGCLIGAALGIATMIFLMPSIESIEALMAVVFVGAWLSAWIAVGNERIAYIGFQIAFAFFLCVIQGSGPGYDMVIARDRVIGILLGNLVVYLIFTRIWPVSLSGRIDLAFRRLLLQLAQLAACKKMSAPTLASSASVEREKIKNFLETLGHEPTWIRPDKCWSESRHCAITAIALLESRLMLFVESFGGSQEVASCLSSMSERYALTENPATNTADLKQQKIISKKSDQVARTKLLKTIYRQIACVEQCP